MVRRIKNTELREEFEALGFADVACFRASGNVVPSSCEGGSEAKLREPRSKRGLGEALGSRSAGLPAQRPPI